MRAASRVADVSINTVTKLLIDAGSACAAHHDETVRGVRAERIECDEIWAFCYSKKKNVAQATAAPPEAGDIWTWTAFDRDSKMILSYRVGDRSGEMAMAFMADLRSRVTGRVQISSDAHKAYAEAVEAAFGGEADYAQIVKLYGKAAREVIKSGHSEAARRYSPQQFTAIIKKVISGMPPIQSISTSFVERNNLTMRMSLRRFTRLSNGFSKRAERHVAALSLYFTFYNFARIHTTLKTTPAMAAGVDTRLRDVEWIVDMVDARAPKPNRPTKYKPRQPPEALEPPSRQP